jgi:hypothetical protein
MAFNVNVKQITIAQTFAQWLGKLSNCNVVIQQKTGTIFPEVRLYCTECNQSTLVYYSVDVVSYQSPISEKNKQIEEFAKAHRHDTIPVPLAQSSIDSFDERKFRTDI